MTRPAMTMRPRGGEEKSSSGARATWGGFSSWVDEAVVDANLIGPLVQLLSSAEFDIKKDAAWAASNAISGGPHDQIKMLVHHGCIKPLCDLLISPGPRMVTGCLEGLENILKVGEAEKNLGILKFCTLESFCFALENQSISC